jgi:hypothetical protein
LDESDCQCKCLNSTGMLDCNSKVPTFKWNDDTCSCEFCPNQPERRILCEKQFNWGWNNKLCSCVYCPLENELEKYCKALGFRFGWSSLNCSCEFCMNRDLRKLDCEKQGSGFIFNDKMCQCDLKVNSNLESGNFSNFRFNSTDNKLDFNMVIKIFFESFGTLYAENFRNVSVLQLFKELFPDYQLNFNATN